MTIPEQMTAKQSAVAVAAIFAAPKSQRRAMVHSNGVARVEIAERIPTHLPDGCKGFRLEWKEICQFMLDGPDFFAGNVITAIELARMPVYPE